MSGHARFWRNLALIGLAHAALITGLVRWSSETDKPTASNIVWMNGSAGDGAGEVVRSSPLPKPVEISTPSPETSAAEDEANDTILASTKSEIQLPAATPVPSATPRSTATPIPKPSPKVKVPPRSTPKPKPSPKPTPKPSPKKMVLAKVEAKARPKPTATPKKIEPKDEVEQKVEKDEPEKNPDTDSSPKPPKSALAPTGRGKGTSAGNGGHGGGASIQSQFGWYGSMLHDRFYSEWAQPTSIASDAKTSAMVRIRIEKDGRISNFEIVRPSGNSAVDESINAVAKRVTKVDPLPAGLGKGDHYDVKINFELNSE